MAVDDPPDMEKSGRKLVRRLVVIAVMLAPLMSAPGTANASWAGLWHCNPYGTQYEYACTTITHAPASGVQVLDRNQNHSLGIFTLHNGDSVVLVAWGKDTSGKCGVYGDSYVWSIAWVTNQHDYSAYIGDYYLTTGPVDYWNSYPDYWGTLGDYGHYLGTGHGACDVFPNG